MILTRRDLLTASAAAIAAGVFAPAGTARATSGMSARRGVNAPIGPISGTPDANGLRLPEGFSSRVIGAAGEKLAGVDATWPPFPDGGGVIATGEGGWRYVVNSNVLTVSVMSGGAGGASSIEFDSNGEIVDAVRILSDTVSNSGGALTPWGTWLSGEEDPLYDQSRVWEADPSGSKQAVARQPLGLFSHAGIACDDNGVVYMTQFHPSGLLYRFTPRVAGSVREGGLEACVVSDSVARWLPIVDPTGESVRVIDQAPGATPFPRARLAWSDGMLYLSQQDGTVSRLDTTTGAFTTLATGLVGGDRPGDICVLDKVYVGSGLSIVAVDADGTVSEIVRIDQAGHDGSSIGGLAFDPTGTRLYFSSRRGPTVKSLGEIIPGLDLAERQCGITYEVFGSFTGAAVVAPVVTAPSTTAPAAPEPTGAPVTVPSATTVAAPAPEPPAEEAGGFPIVPIGAGIAALAAAAAVFAVIRRKGIAPNDNGAVVVVAADTADQTSDVIEPATGGPSAQRADDTVTATIVWGKAPTAESTSAPAGSHHRVFDLDQTTDEMLAAKRRTFILDDDASKLAIPTRWQVGEEGERAESPDDGHAVGDQADSGASGDGN